MKALLVAVLLTGCTTTAPAPPAPACGAPVHTAALPSWARAGFSDDGSGTPHVYGRRGEVVAILFGAPLSSPPAADRSNKILWVAREPVAGPLEITGRLAGTAVEARHTVAGGPGPSVVDLPRPGCWHLTLTWAGRTDTLDLTYQAPATGTG